MLSFHPKVSNGSHCQPIVRAVKQRRLEETEIFHFLSSWFHLHPKNALRLLLRKYPSQVLAEFPPTRAICSFIGISERMENLYQLKSASLCVTLRLGEMQVEGLIWGGIRPPWSPMGSYHLGEHPSQWVGPAPSGPCVSFVCPQRLLPSPLLPTQHSSSWAFAHAVNPCWVPSFHSEPTQSFSSFFQILTQVPPPLSSCEAARSLATGHMYFTSTAPCILSHFHSIYFALRYLFFLNSLIALNRKVFPSLREMINSGGCFVLLIEISLFFGLMIGIEVL